MRHSVLQAAPLRQREKYTRWSRLYGSARALAFARLVAEYQCPLLVLTTDNYQTTELLDELRFFLAGSAIPIWSFPDWETLPYDRFSPWYDITSARLEVLSHLPELQVGIVVVSVTSAAHRLLPADFLSANSLLLKVGDRIDTAKLREDFIHCGYQAVKEVNEHGDIAVRGSLLDIFPMGAKYPYRIDFFDDAVDSIRTFDAETQRSLHPCENICILPAREIDLTEAGIARFRTAWCEHFSQDPLQCPLYTDVSQGIAPAGIEYYLPLFYQQTCHLFEYLPEHTKIVWDTEMLPALETFLAEAEQRYEAAKDDEYRPSLPPKKLFFDEQAMRSHASRFHQIHLCHSGEDHAIEYATGLPPKLPVDARAAEPLAVLLQFIAEFAGRILIVAGGPGRRETLLEMLTARGLQWEVVTGWTEFIQSEVAHAICVAPLENGMLLNTPALAVITDAQLFGRSALQPARRRRHDAETVIRNLVEMNLGDPVVHIDHGVARYRGLKPIESDGITTEFILLEYAGGDKLYVPVTDIEQIARYTGVDPEHAPLHKLGSPQWNKEKRRAAQKIYDVAVELLEINAQRLARKGHGFTLDNDACNAFSQGFPFTETADQSAAIQAMYADMQSPRPMDRLICGDAGFGKTEIALRAAFVAAHGGHQVAMLVPTTLLAQQHYESFADRFSNFPIRVELLSRFRDRKQQQACLQGLQDGSVDIVIGTHRLLQKDIKFSRLGLLIIDEEHRFGVRQKEKFKALRTEVDVLTLTATPIPRTLNMALSDLREFSVIATPPSRRLAVKTFIREWDDELISEAILREIKRGGQVFFLHNDTHSIDRVADQLRMLVPTARVQVAHGQMSERDLESIMSDFYHQRFNVLVCTTIIETGIDIPTANTIIINRADRFGLAQLYQLRGRVGRSYHRAYAWLLIPAEKLTGEARKRLEAIEAMEELGIGFSLAIHDLEIRGAGELLGEEQSGHIQQIGFAMYMQMLEETVETLRSGRTISPEDTLHHGPEVNLHIPVLIPENYLPDVQLRLVMYKRIAAAKDTDELQAVREEMVDRFGLLPEAAKRLFAVSAMKFKLHSLGISRADVASNGVSFRFGENPAISTDAVIDLVQTQADTFQMYGADGIRMRRTLTDEQERMQALEDFIAVISTAGNTALCEAK